MMSTITIGMIFEGLLGMAVYYKYRSHFGSRYPLGLMRSAQASFTSYFLCFQEQG